MSRRAMVSAFLLLLSSLSLWAVTLEKLSLDEMVEASTLIVRARVQSVSAARRGGMIFTDYQLEAAEWFKGSVTGSLLVAVPGGELGGERQVFAGVPTLAQGEEYILFLWRGKSGNLQLVGLSQGLLRIEVEQGRAVASRPPIDGILLDRRSGLPVRDSGMTLPSKDLRNAVRRASRDQNGGQR